MIATPVRRRGGALHLCRATGRGYVTACGRTLQGGTLEVPPRRLWARCWALDLVCRRCDRLGQQAHSNRELATLAGWA